MMDSPTDRASTSFLARALDVIERLGNRLPNPVTLFVVFAALVPVLSWVAVKLEWQHVNPQNEDEMITAVNLLTGENIARMITEAVNNFVNFPPLGIVLIVMLGIGVAERTGMIDSLLRLIVVGMPPRLLTGAVIFSGILSSIAGDAGYVVLLPLAALVFAGVGRHPLAGLCAAFAGVSGGFSANFALTIIDPLLSGFTTPAAQLFDPDYVVYPTANYFLMAASVPILTLAGWWVTEAVVEPRLGKPASLAEGTEEAATDSESTRPITKKEKRGLIAAGLALLASLAILLVMIVPPWGILRGPEGEEFMPVYASMSFLMAIMFFIPGLAYGICSGTIREDRDVADMTAQSIATLGPYIVMAFACAQFIEYFRWSNIGILTALTGADFLKSIGLTGAPLLLGLVFFTAAINLVMGSASAKWAIMAPIFVPMMMALGYSPELAQASYRVGDSITNVITPLNPYFAIIIGVCQRYVPNMGLGTLISSMLPYSIAFGIVWTIVLMAWYSFGLPLGPGAGLMYTP